MNDNSIRVLMVHVDPCIRVLKEIKALHNKGLYVDIFCNRLSITPECRKYANHVYHWDTTKSFFQFLAGNYHNYDIIHCHNEPNSITAAVLSSCPDRPVIYDCHDFSSVRNPRLSAEALALERICFTKSAATIHVSEGMKKLAFEKYGPGLSIVLYSLPALEDLLFKPVAKLEQGTHIVYQGTINSNCESLFSYRNYLPYFSKICNAGVNVHVFPSRNISWQMFPEYMNFASDNHYMHIYQSLPYIELLEYISRFKWGFLGFNFDDIPEENKAFLNNALPNKLFDYLYANVCPIVINDDAAANFVEKYNVGYRAKNIDDLIEICKTDNPQPPLADKSIINMDRHIKKLIILYKECLDNHMHIYNNFKNKDGYCCDKGIPSDSEK